MYAGFDTVMWLLQRERCHPILSSTSRRKTSLTLMVLVTRSLEVRVERFISSHTPYPCGGSNITDHFTVAVIANCVDEFIKVTHLSPRCVYGIFCFP